MTLNTEDTLSELIRRCGDSSIIRAAYSLAEKAHEGQLRRSGEDYITHPRAVAMLLTRETRDAEAVAAALLHDTVEDTATTLEDVAEACGESVAKLVDGLTKVDRIPGKDMSPLVLQKLIAATAGDMRVLLIKLCDRLHNMRTIHHLGKDKQRRIAAETRKVYVPLARRIGVRRLSDELDEMSFAVLEPEAEARIAALMAERSDLLAAAKETVLSDLTAGLRELGMGSFEVSVRVKSTASLHAKMSSLGVSFDQVHDLLACRVVVQQEIECYQVLGVVHRLWPPLVGRFLDHIALPKHNLYQSLHTTIMLPGGTRCEVQIRTERMHERAEHGFAAHWRYKAEGRSGSSASEQFRELSEELLDGDELLLRMRAELSEEQIVAFTPSGDVIDLPFGATALDFAYFLHSEIGDHCIGATFDGRACSLTERIPSGSTVRVMVDQGREVPVSPEWLEAAVTARARRRLRSRLRQDRGDESADWRRYLVGTTEDEGELSAMLEDEEARQDIP